MKAKSKIIGDYILALCSGVVVVLVLLALLGTIFFVSFGYVPARLADSGQRLSPYGKERQQVEDLPHFTRILAEVGEISVQYGAKSSVFIENAYYLDTLYVDAKGTLLLRSTVSNRRNVKEHKNRDRVQITLPVLTAIQAEEYANIDVGPGFSGKKIDISVSGMASARLEQVEFASMRLDLSGMSDFQAGAARIQSLDAFLHDKASADIVSTATQARLNIYSYGFSDFTLEGGSIGEARVQANESSNVKLLGFADGAPLLAKVYDIAEVQYSGAPEIVEMELAAAGSLVALD